MGELIEALTALSRCECTVEFNGMGKFRLLIPNIDPEAEWDATHWETVHPSSVLKAIGFLFQEKR